MRNPIRLLTTFAAVAVALLLLSPGILRAQQQGSGTQSNKSKETQNPSVQAQQEAPGQQQQNPTSSPVPANPEGAAPYEPPPGPPLASVSPPSYENEYVNQADNQQQTPEVNQLQDQEEGLSQGGSAGGPAPTGGATQGAAEGENYVGPDGMPNPPTPPPCQGQSQKQSCGRQGGPPA
jgi:hypothetical protein